MSPLPSQQLLTQLQRHLQLQHLPHPCHHYRVNNYLPNYNDTYNYNIFHTHVTTTESTTTYPITTTPTTTTSSTPMSPLPSQQLLTQLQRHLQLQHLPRRRQLLSRQLQPHLSQQHQRPLLLKALTGKQFAPYQKMTSPPISTWTVESGASQRQCSAVNDQPLRVSM